MTTQRRTRLRERLVRALDRADRRWGKRRLFLRRSTDPQTYRRILELGRRPILIGGCGRSGTSMLLAILSCHPEVHAVERETHAFCPTGYERDIDRGAEFVLENVFRLLIAADIAPSRTRWCEKTPKNIQFAERALAYLGSGTRFLHLVRDGRDVITSRHRNAPERAWVTPERWIDDAAAGRAIEDHPQVLTVRYEDVVRSLEPTLRRICGFLELEFHRDLLDYPAASPLPRDEIWQPRLRAISAASIGRWRAPEHDAVVGRLLADPSGSDLLHHYGYVTRD